MAAKDKFHDAVKNALVKDGWMITHDPLELEIGEVSVSIDLGAENILAAEKQGRKIAVEIKNFLGASNIYEFHLALGQFLNYRIALEDEPERILYLAVPQETHETFFKKELVQKSIRTYAVRLIVYNVASEEITEWIS